MDATGGTTELLIPELARVRIDTTDNDQPTVTIWLDERHRGVIDAISIDIDDFLDDWTPGGVYFTGSDALSARDVRLLKFIELCTHWDFDGDGTYDADYVIESILGALRQSKARPKPFVRPAGGIYARALMALMPPQPDRHIVFSYEDLRPRFRRRHYLMAVPMILAFLAVAWAQTAAAPWMKYSVLSAFRPVSERFGWPGIIAGFAVVIAYIVIARRIDLRYPARSGSTLSSNTIGFFSRAAVSEEQTFREGAEHWNARQRVTSCLVFGAIHLANLFYPLATVLPLALAGGVFMMVYLRNYRATGRRRNAILEAGITHRVYNRIALSLAVVYFVIVIGNIAAPWIMNLVGFIVGLAVTWGTMFTYNRRAAQHATGQVAKPGLPANVPA